MPSRRQLQGFGVADTVRNRRRDAAGEYVWAPRDRAGRDFPGLRGRHHQESLAGLCDLSQMSVVARRRRDSSVTAPTN